MKSCFFGQDGYLDDDDDNEDDEQEEVEPKDVKADGVEKSPTTEKPKVFAGRKGSPPGLSVWEGSVATWLRCLLLYDYV